MIRKAKYWMLDHPMLAFLLVVPVVALLYAVLAGATGTLDLQGLLSGALSGLIASLGTYALVRYYFLEKKSSGIRDWLRFGSTGVAIVPTYLEHKPDRHPIMKYYVVPPFDAEAAGLLTQLIREADVHYPRRKVVGSHRLLPSILGDNLITLCLPQRNQYARIILGLYQDIFINNQSHSDAIAQPNVRGYIEDFGCERDYLGLGWEPIFVGNNSIPAWKIRHYGHPSDAPAAWFKSSINLHPTENVHKHGRVNYDYCLIVKGPNPMNPAAGVLVICGIHGIGTLGGALYLHENRTELHRR